MLLDRKKQVLQILETMKKTYLKLIVLKQLEDEAYDSGEYRSLHELSCDERILIEDINSSMKCIVPDLVSLKAEEDVQRLLSELDKLRQVLVRKSLQLRKNLELRVRDTKRKLGNLGRLPKRSSSAAPRVVNIRA
jgi:hypothetical protein